MTTKDRMAAALTSELDRLAWKKEEIEVRAPAMDSILRAMRDPPHEITAAVVPVTQDRTEALRIWNGMIDAILHEDRR